MPHVAVGKGVGTKISALVARTKVSIDRAMAKAANEQKRRQDRILSEQRAQSMLEKRLDEILAEAAVGLTAALEFGRLPEVQALVRVRSSIEKVTPLYSAFEDSHTYVAIVYKKDALEFVIDGSRASMVQGVGKATRFVPCAMNYSFPLADKNWRFRRAWLRFFFLQNFEGHWYSHDVEYNEQDVMEDRSPVKNTQLREFDLVDTRSAQAGKWGEEWCCNHVLIRLLCECSDPKKLGQHFKRTLAKLD